MTDQVEKTPKTESPLPPDWNRIAASPEFRRLLAAKRKFIVPVFILSVTYYLLLQILVGFAPRLMSIKVFGSVTLAYLFALSQFVVGGIVAIFYLRASAKLDVATETLLKQERDALGVK